MVSPQTLRPVCSRRCCPIHRLRPRQLRRPDCDAMRQAPKKNGSRQTAANRRPVFHNYRHIKDIAFRNKRGFNGFTADFQGKKYTSRTSCKFGGSVSALFEIISSPANAHIVRVNPAVSGCGSGVRIAIIGREKDAGAKTNFTPAHRKAAEIPSSSAFFSPPYRP